MRKRIKKNTYIVKGASIKFLHEDGTHTLKFFGDEVMLTAEEASNLKNHVKLKPVEA